MRGNPTLFHHSKSIEKNIEKILILTKAIGKTFSEKINSDNNQYYVLYI